MNLKALFFLFPVSVFVTLTSAEELSERRQFIPLIVRAGNLDPVKVTAKAGGEVPFQWVFEGDVETNAEFEIDVFRALATTVVPMQKSVSLPDPVVIADGGVRVTGHAISFPESDSPQTYLVKLLKKRSGKRIAVHLAVLNILPELSIASLFEGLKVGGIAGNGKGAVANTTKILKLLKSEGVNIQRSEGESDSELDVGFLSVSSDIELTDALKRKGKPSLVVISVSRPVTDPGYVSRIYHVGKAKILVMDQSVWKGLPNSAESLSLLHEFLQGKP